MYPIHRLPSPLPSPLLLLLLILLSPLLLLSPPPSSFPSPFPVFLRSTEEVKQNVDKAVHEIVDPIRSKVCSDLASVVECLVQYHQTVHGIVNVSSSHNCGASWSVGGEEEVQPFTFLDLVQFQVSSDVFLYRTVLITLRGRVCTLSL